MCMACLILASDIPRCPIRPEGWFYLWCSNFFPRACGWPSNSSTVPCLQTKHHSGRGGWRKPCGCHRMFRIGEPMMCRIHLQGFCNRCTNLLGHGNLPFRAATLISPGPLAPADGSLAFNCPATTPACCQLSPVHSSLSPKHVASSLDRAPDVFINKLTDQTIQLLLLAKTAVATSPDPSSPPLLLPSPICRMQPTCPRSRTPP